MGELVPLVTFDGWSYFNLDGFYHFYLNQMFELLLSYDRRQYMSKIQPERGSNLDTASSTLLNPSVEPLED